MATLLELRDVNYSYHSMQGETHALSNLNFTVEEGEFLAVIGPSGCGKSTLLSLLCGLIAPTGGSIRFRGHDLTGNDTLQMGYMLQKDQLLEWRDIRSNVRLGLEIRHECTPENLAYADELLETYGLGQFTEKRPSELSGGMRQRAALIRTLVLHPSLLLLDEPFSALDYQTRLTVGDDIGRIIRQEKKTAILVTHDLSEAISLGDRILVLSRRPGTIRTILPIRFPKGLSPLEKRSDSSFKHYFNLLWKEFNENEGNIQ